MCSSGLTALSSSSPSSDPHRVAGGEDVLSRWYADRPDVVGVGHWALQLHQGDVVVVGVCVVIRVGDDPLQVPLHYILCVLFLGVKPQKRLPSARLGVSGGNRQTRSLKRSLPV